MPRGAGRKGEVVWTFGIALWVIEPSNCAGHSMLCPYKTGGRKSEDKNGSKSRSRRKANGETESGSKTESGSA